MVSWIVIGILILLILLFFKARHTQHRLFALLLIALILFFYITGAKIIAENKVDFGTFEGVMKAGKLYLVWLGNAFNNVKVIAGSTVKMNWGSNTSSVK